MLPLSRTSRFPEGKYAGSDVLVEDAIKGNYQYVVDAVDEGVFTLDYNANDLLGAIKGHMDRRGDNNVMSFGDVQPARDKCLDWLDFIGLTLDDRELDMKVDDEGRYTEHIL